MICDKFASDNTMDTVFAKKLKGLLDKILPEEYHNTIPELSIK